MALTPGSRLGPYEILASLGAGGMGNVYQARDTRLDRMVAIKILRPRAGIDVSREVLDEARAVARLNHPNIAALYDVVDETTLEGAGAGGRVQPPFLVMEFVDGRPLSALAAEGPMDVDRALDIGIQLASALAAAHQAGIIHRDVKPANTMVTPAGVVKLLDLGIARVVSIDAGATTRTLLTVPDGPAWYGSPAYMAPEQLVGRPPDARSDVYGTGVLLFELLTGRRPYNGSDPVVLAVTVATGPLPRVSTLRPDVPRPVVDVIARAMAKAPDHRFATAVELRDALTAVRAGGRAPAARPLWRRPALYAAAAVAAAGLAAGSLWLNRPRPHPPAPIAILPAVTAGDPALETFGAGLVSMVADNLASVPGLTLASAAGVASKYRDAGRDVSRAARDLGAGYTIDLRISGSRSRVRVDGSLVEAGQPAPLWQGQFEGDPLAVNTWVSDQIADTLEDIGVFQRKLSKADREKLRRLPTRDAAAFAAYAEGQARLDTAKGAPDVEAAIASFQDALARDSSFALARAALSQACGRMYAYTKGAAWIERAAEEANRALTIDPDRAQVHYSLASVYYDTGRLEDARQHAQQAVRLSPASDDAHRLLGMVLAARGDLDKALGELNLAIQLRPDYARNHAMLGFELYKAARYAQAVEPYRRAAALEPTAGNFVRLGAALHASGNVQEAIGNYKHAVEIARSPSALSNLAFSYYSANKFEEALANWQEAMKLDQSPPPVRFYNLGDVYQRLGQTDKARTAYAEAIARATRLLKVNPSDVEQIATIAVCEAKLGRRDEASLRAAEALGLKPTDTGVLYKAAVVDALGGNADQAIGHLKDALARGYPRAFARGDYDLQRLRNDPRFASLVAQQDN
jgi:eukaryotic-like serine/threonine-protein kinase